VSNSGIPWPVTRKKDQTNGVCVCVCVCAAKMRVKHTCMNVHCFQISEKFGDGLQRIVTLINKIVSDLTIGVCVSGHWANFCHIFQFKELI